MPKSKNTFYLPLPKGAKIKMIRRKDSIGHPPPYQTAIDFAVGADTEVLAPLDGKIITVVDNNSKHGPSLKFANMSNYIQIKHQSNEISDLMHLAKGSALVKVGDTVKIGQLIAKTGLSGYMTEPHLHWFVYKNDNSKAGFTGLEIRTTA